MKKRRRSKEETAQTKDLKEIREGVIAGQALSGQPDVTSGDEITGADTTVFPTYINEEGEVTHGGPRTTVDEDVTPNGRANEFDLIGEVKTLRPKRLRKRSKKKR